MTNFVQRVLSFLAAIEAAILRAFPASATVKPAASLAPATPAKPASAGSEVAKVTADGINALEKMFGPLVDIVRGKGTVKDDEEAINIVANIVAVFNPEIAPAIGLLESAEPVALYIFDQIRATPAMFAPAPRPGPPMTEADWSHGIPKAQPVDNPSGAIGGA